MNASRQILAILTLTALMCGVWTAALRVLPQPSLAETNYEANRLRVERWLLGPPSPVVLVGTSLTGRLLPGYFQDTPLAGTENLGLDGASPDTGLRLVLMRNPAPALVLLEVHLLSKKPGTNDRQLLDLGSFEESDAYTPLEKDILRFADQWTLRGRVAEDVMTRLKAALSPAHLVLLAATTAQANLTTRFNNVFEVELP